MEAKPDYIKERIKLLTEWFKLVSTLLVLSCGSVGYLITKENIFESLYIQMLLISSVSLILILFCVLLYINVKIIKFVNELNSQ